MRENICHFIPYRNDANTIHTINFVWETEPQVYQRLKSEAVYKLYYIRSGHGCIHTPGKTMPLKHGDLFFTFPASPFAIESGEDFTYMYISFVGLRGNAILEQLKIDHGHFLFPDAQAVENFWENGMATNPNMLALMAESVLLYTFAFLGNRLLYNSKSPRYNQSVNQIKMFIDDHFTDQNFSLDYISQNLSYNKKYISSVFKRHIGISVIEYLNTIRIQNACTMIDQGFTSINDIADRCGYADPQYFSRVFKSRMGMLPTQYVKSKHSG